MHFISHYILQYDSGAFGAIIISKDSYGTANVIF